MFARCRSGTPIRAQNNGPNNPVEYSAKLYRVPNITMGGFTATSDLTLRQAERLDKIYCCVQCKAIFLFIEDVQHHKTDSGHQEASVLPFS